MGNQSKDITKIVLIVVVSMLLGEGVLGVGIYWPFLLMLLDWPGVYWFALILGLLASALYNLPVGIPSLLFVSVVSGLSMVFSSRKEVGWIVLVASLAGNFIFDLFFGLHWSVWDGLAIILAWLFSRRLLEKTESIKLNYK